MFIAELCLSLLLLLYLVCWDYAAAQCSLVSEAEAEELLRDILEADVDSFNFTIHNLNTNCLSAAQKRGYSSTTVAVNYTMTNALTSTNDVAQVICVCNNSVMVWKATKLFTSTNSEDFGAGILSAEELLTIEADISCLRCFQHPANDSPTFCESCEPHCTGTVGLQQCYGEGACCNYYDIDDSCVEECGFNQVVGADYTCLCSGLYGPPGNCSMCNVTGLCVNGSPDESNCTCDCTGTGYTGSICDQEINECEGNPCENGATCIDQIASYTCACAPGFTDELCATNIDDCHPGLCLNGGTCIDGVASYTCDCAPGYSSINCSTNIDDCSPSPCANGSTCIDGINQFECVCLPGFTGQTCMTEIDKFPCTISSCEVCSEENVCGQCAEEFELSADGSNCIVTEALIPQGTGLSPGVVVAIVLISLLLVSITLSLIVISIAFYLKKISKGDGEMSKEL